MSKTDVRINKVWYIHEIQFFSAIYRNEVLIHTIGMDLKTSY
jgi:hypothetical protein